MLKIGPTFTVLTKFSVTVKKSKVLLARVGLSLSCKSLSNTFVYESCTYVSLHLSAAKLKSPNITGSRQLVSETDSDKAWSTRKGREEGREA